MRRGGPLCFAVLGTPLWLLLLLLSNMRINEEHRGLSRCWLRMQAHARLRMARCSCNRREPWNGSRRRVHGREWSTSCDCWAQRCS